MNGIIVTTNGEIYHREFNKPLYKSAGEVVGGWIEFTRPKRLGKPYCMIVNEDYIDRCLPFNHVGSYLYGTDEHGHPVLGNIIIMKEHGDDIVDMKPAEIEEIESILKFIYKSVK